LAKHLQQDPPCAIKAERKAGDGCTKEQEKRLRSRKKSRPNMTEEERWTEIYMILFPEDETGTLPSPCKCSHRHSKPQPSSFCLVVYDTISQGAEAGAPGIGLKDYSAFLDQEMPLVVHQELETAFQNDLCGVEESHRPQIERFIVEQQRRLFNRFEDLSAKTEGETQVRTQEVPNDDGLQGEFPLEVPQAVDPGLDVGLPNDASARPEQTWNYFEEDFTVDFGLGQLLDPMPYPVEPGEEI